MKIIAVTNRLLCKNNFLEQIEIICKCYPYAIILREKDLNDVDYENLAIKCKDICNKYNVNLFINSKINIAIKINIKNIQLSFSDFIKNKNKLKNFNNIAVSIHSTKEATELNNSLASFVIAGHIFQTNCKKDLQPKGIHFLQQICTQSTKPVFAIGGINNTTINQLKDINISGVCLMSFLMEKNNISKTINTIKNI